MSSFVSLFESLKPLPYGTSKTWHKLVLIPFQLINRKISSVSHQHSKISRIVAATTKLVHFANHIVRFFVRPSFAQRLSKSPRAKQQHSKPTLQNKNIETKKIYVYLRGYVFWRSFPRWCIPAIPSSVHISFLQATSISLLHSSSCIEFGTSQFTTQSDILLHLVDTKIPGVIDASVKKAIFQFEEELSR